MRFEEFRARDGHILMSVNPMNVLFVGEHVGADGKACHITLANGSQHVIAKPRAEVVEQLERAMHEEPVWAKSSYHDDGRELDEDAAAAKDWRESSSAVGAALSSLLGDPQPEPEALTVRERVELLRTSETPATPPAAGTVGRRRATPPGAS